MEEVFIVGGGFVGLYLSYLLVRRGIRATVFEEHNSIGAPEHCTGLISEKGLQRLGILDRIRREGLIINSVRCAKIYYFGQWIKVCLDNQRLLVVDRPGLDRLVYRMAKDTGANVLLARRVNSVDRLGNITVKGQKMKAEIVILAEGASRRLLRRIYNKHNVSLLVPAVQADVRTKECIKSNIVYILKLKDYFAWAVPLGPNKYRVGVASKLMKNQVEFIKSIAKKFGATKIEKIFGGLVNFSGPISKFVFSENLAAVGDAVGQNKPISGGGVVLGGLSAIILASTIKLRLEDRASLYSYEKIWWEIFGTNIRLMQIISKIVFSPRLYVASKFLSRIIPRYIHTRRDYDLPLFSVKIS